MKRRISLMLILYVFLICTAISVEAKEVESDCCKLQDFEKLLERYYSEYIDLNERGMTKVCNEKVEIADGLEVEINGMIADKYKIALFYTLRATKGQLDEEFCFPDLYIDCKNLVSYSGNGFTGSGDLYREKNEIKFIKTLYGMLEPENDKIHFSIQLYGNTPKNLDVPFLENDFLETYFEKNLDIVISKDYADYKINKIYGSPMETLLFMETHKKEGYCDKYEDEDIDLKGSSLFYNEKEIENHGGGGTRIDKEISLEYNRFNSIDKDTDRLLWEYENKKYEIVLNEDKENIEDVKKFPFEKVSKDKIWTITFNQELDSSTVNQENIFVKDSKNNSIDTNAVLDNSSNTVHLYSMDEYIRGETYTLYLTKNIKSASGVWLNKLTTKIFSIE